MVASLAGWFETVNLDWRINDGAAAPVIFFDAFLRFGGISDENIDIFDGFEVELALARHQQRHERANERIELAVARVAAVFVVMAPVIARRSVNVADDFLVGACFGDLVSVQVGAAKNDVEFAQVELAHRFDRQGWK